MYLTFGKLRGVVCSLLYASCHFHNLDTVLILSQWLMCVLTFHFSMKDIAKKFLKIYRFGKRTRFFYVVQKNIVKTKIIEEKNLVVRCLSNWNGFLGRQKVLSFRSYLLRFMHDVLQYTLKFWNLDIKSPPHHHLPILPLKKKEKKKKDSISISSVGLRKDYYKES